MNTKINESYNFLVSEFKRLKLKEKNQKISSAEKEALKKIKSFIGSSGEKRY